MLGKDGVFPCEVCGGAAGVMGACAGGRNTRIHKQILSVTFRISRHPESTLGEKIRKFRLEKGLRQKNLAILLRVNEMTIVNWEMDRRKPAKRHMEMLVGGGENSCPTRQLSSPITTDILCFKGCKKNLNTGFYS